MKKKTEVQQVNWANTVYKNLVLTTIGEIKKQSKCLASLSEAQMLNLLEVLDALYTGMLPTRTKKTVIDILAEFGTPRAYEMLTSISAQEDNAVLAKYAKDACDQMIEQRR
jgi:hypothetical protein